VLLPSASVGGRSSSRRLSRRTIQARPAARAPHRLPIARSPPMTAVLGQHVSPSRDPHEALRGTSDMRGQRLLDGGPLDQLANQRFNGSGLSLVRIGSSCSASTSTMALTTQPGRRGRWRHDRRSRTAPPVRIAASFVTRRRSCPCRSWFDSAPTTSRQPGSNLPRLLSADTTRYAGVRRVLGHRRPTAH
jgi:hypothetical protein